MRPPDIEDLGSVLCDSSIQTLRLHGSHEGTGLCGIESGHSDIM